MENLVKEEQIVIVDSDEVDTLDTLLSCSITIDEELDKNSDDTSYQGNYGSLEKISLEDAHYSIFNENEAIDEECVIQDNSEITMDKEDDILESLFNKDSVVVDELGNADAEDNLFKSDIKDVNYEKCINSINLEYVETLKNELLEPLELLSKLEDLREKSRQTVKKLRELKTTCEQAIIDIEHKIEFEDFGVSEGFKYSMIIKELRIKRRFIKNTLDKYDSVSLTLDTLDKSLGKNFIKSQIKTINKVSKIQSSRQYTPRVLKNLEITGKSNMKNNLDDLEVQIESILENANM